MNRIDWNDRLRQVAEEARRRAEEAARAKTTPAPPRAADPARSARPVPGDMLERRPRLFGREIVLDGSAEPPPLDSAVVETPPSTVASPDIPAGPRTDVLHRPAPFTASPYRLDADFDRQQLLQALGPSPSAIPVAATLVGSPTSLVEAGRALVGVKRANWGQAAPSVLGTKLRAIAEKAGSLEARATRVKEALSAVETRHARTLVGFKIAGGFLEKAAYKAAVARELSKLVPGKVEGSLQRMAAARQELVGVRQHAGEAEATLRDLAGSAPETPWALQEVREIQRTAGSAQLELSRTESRGQMLAAMDAGAGLLTEEPKGVAAPTEGGVPAEGAPGAEFEFTEEDLARIGTGLDPTKPPAQNHWSEQMVNTVCELGRQQGGVTDEQGGRNFELAKVVLGSSEGETGARPLEAADLAAVLKMAGVDLTKVDPNQLQSAAKYVSGATGLEDQQQKLRKAIDNFQVLEKIGLPKMSRQQMVDQLWGVAKVPGHALAKLSDAEVSKKFQEVLGTVNAGPGKSEIKIGKHNLKLEVGENGTVTKSSCKKPGFFSKIVKIAKIVTPIALTVMSFIPVTMPFARAAQGVIGLVQAIKTKSILGIASAGASFFGGAGKLLSRGLQGVSQIKSGNWMGGLASIGSVVGSGLKGVAGGLGKVADKLGKVSDKLSAVGTGVASFEAYKKAGQAVSEAKEALQAAQASGDTRAVAAAQKQLSQAESAKRAAVIGAAAGAATAASALVGSRGLFPGKSKDEKPAQTRLESRLQLASRGLGVAQAVAGKDYAGAAVSALSIGATVHSARKGGEQNRLNDAANMAQAGLGYYQAEKGRTAANRAVSDAQARLDAARRQGNPELIRQAEGDLKKAKGAAESALLGGIAAGESLLSTAKDIADRNRAEKAKKEQEGPDRQEKVRVALKVANDSAAAGEQTADRLAAVENDETLSPGVRRAAREERERLKAASDALHSGIQAAKGDPEKMRAAVEAFEKVRTAAASRETQLTEMASTPPGTSGPAAAPGAADAGSPGLASMRRPQTIAAARVTKGVTVWEVSMRTGVPVDRILEFNAQSGNPLDPRSLQIGQQILVPMDAEDVKFKALDAGQVHNLKLKAIEEKKARESITVPPVRSSDLPVSPEQPRSASAQSPTSERPAGEAGGQAPGSRPIGLHDLDNAGDALAGAMLGLVELAVSPVILAFKAVENIGGALAYSATDLIFGAPSPRFSAQADAVSGSLDATKEFFAHHAPSEVPGLLFDALTAGLDYADEALDRGDAFDAGRGFANFAGGVYLLEKTLEGVHLPKGLEAAPSLRPATAGGPAPAGTASEVSGTSMMGSGEGVPPRLPPRPAPAEPSVPARPPVAKPTEPSPGTPEGTSSGGDVGTIQPKTTAGAAAPGNAGRFADLDAKAVVGDQLTPHHMPQAAAKFTPREHGGALVLPHEEHVLTRTYGAAGRRIVREEIGLSFRDVLARDIRDIRRITGVKYNEGLRLLLEYYRRYFPEVISKPPKSPGP